VSTTPSHRACLALARKLLKRAYHTLRALGEDALQPARSLEAVHANVAAAACGELAAVHRLIRGSACTNQLISGRIGTSRNRETPSPSSPRPGPTPGSRTEIRMGTRAHTPTSSASTAPVKRFALGPAGRPTGDRAPPLALHHNNCPGNPVPRTTATTTHPGRLDRARLHR
jgi:hypothetical protein